MILLTVFLDGERDVSRFCYMRSPAKNKREYSMLINPALDKETCNVHTSPNIKSAGFWGVGFFVAIPYPGKKHPCKSISVLFQKQS